MLTFRGKIFERMIFEIRSWGILSITNQRIQ